MREAAATRLVDPPEDATTVHVGSRRAYAGDVGPSGRLRLDGLARLLQDVAGDDLEGDDGIGPGWVVRRALMAVDEPARLREHLELSTWCSGVGRRWAERRTSVRGDRGARAEAAVLWVHVDLPSGRPLALPPAFDARCSPASLQRAVTARLHHDLAVPEGAVLVPWRVRHADLDVLGHVNNAVAGAMVEEAAVVVGGDGRPRIDRVEIEYRAAIDPGDEVSLLAVRQADQLRLWVVRAGGGGPGDVLPAEAVRVTARATLVG